MLAGFAFLTKGFVAWAIISVVILPFCLIEKQFKVLIRLAFVGCFVALVFVLPWVMMVNWQASGYWHYFFWVEHINRFSSDNAQHLQPFWYYIPVLIIVFMPWSGALIPVAQALSFKRSNSLNRYLACWFLFPLLFLSIAKGKLIPYILPIFAPLAMLVALGIEKHQRPITAWLLTPNLLLISALLFAFIYYVCFKGFYQADELYKVILLVIAIFSWACCCIALWLNPKRNPVIKTALMPVVLMLSYPVLTPNTFINSKMPADFIASVKPEITPTMQLVVQEITLGSTISWVYNRRDVYFWKNAGELSYGLNYPDAWTRYIPTNDLPEFIQANRLNSKGVAFFIRDIQDVPEKLLPKPNKIIQKDRLWLYLYYAK